MTNLTTEQYRDVLACVQGKTDSVLTIQHLLRRAVANFYKRFKVYPEFAGVAPGKIGIFGEETEYNDGLAVSMAFPLATVMVGRKSQYKTFTVATSSDVGKPHKVTFSTSKKRPLKKGLPKWLNYVKAVLSYFPRDSIPGFEALLETSLPAGEGFGSGSAIKVATYTFLEVLTGRKIENLEKALTCQKAEEVFIEKQCGRLEPITSVMAKDRQGLVIDFRNHELEFIPFTHPDYAFIAIDSHLKDTMMGDEYPEISELIAWACKLLDVENLRDCTEDFETLESRLKEKIKELEALEELDNDQTWDLEKIGKMLQRVKHYVHEVKRIEEALAAWREGDMELFGKKMTESNNSVKEGFDLCNPLLNFYVQASLEVEGVLGARMTGKGLGFGGGVVILIKRENIGRYCQYVLQRYYKYERQARLDCLANWMKRTEKARAAEKAERERKRLEQLASGKKKCRRLSKQEETLKPDFEIKPPTFYIASPFPGARLFFVTKADLLRSLLAEPAPHPKSLVRSALQVFAETFGTKPEVAALAPATVKLFGEFTEYEMGNIVSVALPMLTAIVGGRSDDVCFSFKTTARGIQEPTTSKFPVPCVRLPTIQPQEWMNFTNGAVSLFNGPVPGFNAVIHSSVPMQAGLNSCSALQASIYTFLEALTHSCTPDPFEKADRCERSEKLFLQKKSTSDDLTEPCSALKYIPTFLCREGHVIFINCDNKQTSHLYFDDPRYVFLFATCQKNTNDVTLKSLNDRIVLCHEAAELLGKKSLAVAEEKHIRCLKKRDASEEMVKRASYVITENQRSLEARKAIKARDYERLGFLMSQSHKALRCDFEITSPEVEALIALAIQVQGVLGAKMIGIGMNATIAILIPLCCTENCIQFMKKNFIYKDNPPSFYITKPSSGAFSIDLNEELDYIP